MQKLHRLDPNHPNFFSDIVTTFYEKGQSVLSLHFYCYFLVSHVENFTSKYGTHTHTHTHTYTHTHTQLERTQKLPAMNTTKKNAKKNASTTTKSAPMQLRTSASLTASSTIFSPCTRWWSKTKTVPLRT